MTQKVLKVGSSAAVTIPKEYLRLLNLHIGASVEVSIDETKKTLVYRLGKKDARNDARREKIADLTLNFIERYRGDLEALADK